MTPAERTRYEELLRLDVAKQSPLDLACLIYPETKRWPHLELLNEYLVALAEYRLTSAGPVPAGEVQWWYESVAAKPLQTRTLVQSPNDIPEQDQISAYGAFDRRSGAPIVFQLAVSMMPRAGKSRLTTEVFPLWLLLLEEDLQIGLATYSDTFAGDWGEAMKMNLLNHHSSYEEDGKTPFLPYPEGGPRAARDILKVRGSSGRIRYTGTGGAVTGKTLHVPIADDLVKNEDDILSEAVRTSIHRFIDSTWTTRKTRFMKPGTPFPFAFEVRMATRWHRMDPIGYSCYDEDTNEPNQAWCILNIPALCNDEATDPLGRKLGEGHPNAAGLTRADLERLKAADPRTFSALYQGSPVAEGGNLISTDFKSYWLSPDGEHIMWRQLAPDAEPGVDVPEIHTVPLNETVRFAAADMAATKKSASDYTVLGTFAYSREHDMLFITSWFRNRITTDQYNEELVPIIEDHQCSTTVVENVTYGQTFGQGLERRNMQVEFAPAVSDKVARIIDSQVSGRIRKGKLRVPSGGAAPWLDVLVGEVGLFPNDDHDDQPDVLAFANLFVRDLPDWNPPSERKVKTPMQVMDEQADRQHRRGRRRRGAWPSKR